MTKGPKSTAAWAADMLAFSKSGKGTVGQGQTPSPNTQWAKEYEKIQKCPKQFSRKGNQTTLSFAKSSKNKSADCSCGWHDGSNPLLSNIPRSATQYSRVSSTTSTTSNNDNSSPPVEVPFLIPNIPKARTKLDDVKNKCIIYPGKEGEEFDLLAFGLTNGNCPHCGEGKPQPKIRLNPTVKIIHTLREPRFVQGVGMNCNKCNKPFQSLLMPRRDL